MTSDYSPVEKFEQEEGLRPRTPPHLTPTASTPAPKKKRRKAKHRTITPPPPAASQTASNQQSEDKAGSDGSEPPKRANTVGWLRAEAVQLKKDNKIPKDITRPTDFAKFLRKRMRKAAETDKSIRLVDWPYIKNNLRAWGLWPIESIKIS